MNLYVVILNLSWIVPMWVSSHCAGSCQLHGPQRSCDGTAPCSFWYCKGWVLFAPAAGLDCVGRCVRGSHLPCFASHSLSTLNQFSQQFFFPSGNNSTSIPFPTADTSPKPPSCKCMSLANAFNRGSLVMFPSSRCQNLPLDSSAERGTASGPGPA